MTTPTLLALSDLHVAHPQNRAIVAALVPGSKQDWLLLAGDVGELYPDIEWALRTLAGKFATVVWTPGNCCTPIPITAWKSGAGPGSVPRQILPTPAAPEPDQEITRRP